MKRNDIHSDFWTLTLPAIQGEMTTNNWSHWNVYTFRANGQLLLINRAEWLLSEFRGFDCRPCSWICGRWWWWWGSSGIGQLCECFAFAWLNCYCFCYIYTHGDYEESKETGCSHTHTNALRRSHSRTLPNGRLTAQIMRLLCRPLLLTLLNHLHRTLDFTALRFFDTLEAEKYVFCLCSANGVTVHRWAKNHP